MKFGDEPHSMRMKPDKRGVKHIAPHNGKRIIIGSDDGVLVSAVGKPAVQLALFVVVMKYFQTG